MKALVRQWKSIERYGGRRAFYEEGGAENGPLPQVAKHIMLKSSTVTGIVGWLEQKGLVRRMRNSPDRRMITIELTEVGNALAQHAPPPIQRKIVDGLERLPTSETEKIVDGLNMLTHMFDVQDLEVE